MSELTLNLKDELDKIDGKIYDEVYDGYLNSRLRVLIGMWDKGRAVGGVFTPLNTPSYREISRDTGRDHKAIKRWHDIYRKYPNKDDYIKLEAEPKAVAWTQRALAEKQVKQLESPPLPEGKFSVIYADPPWPVGSIVLDDKWTSGIDDKYPTMTIDEIKLLPVIEKSADDCSLFIWTTHTFLPDTMDIIKQWGFKYYCTITWNKGSGWTQHGFHKMTEFLIFAYKGKINIEQHGEAIPTLIKEGKTYHSKKPDSIRESIKNKTPDGRLEMFARDEYEGWTPWGNEV